MNKKILNRIFIALIIIAIIALTIVASYFGSLLFTSNEFKIGYLLPFIGSVALVLFLLGLSVSLVIKIIGGKD